MAYAVSFIFSMRDAKNKTTRVPIRVPNGFSIAQYVEFGQAAAQIIAALSTCQITSVQASLRLDLAGSTIRATAQAISDIFERAIITVNSSIAGLYARFFVPTLDDTKVLTGTDQIDLTDVDVAAYVALIEDGLDLGGSVFIQPVDLRGNDLADVNSAREVFRES